MNDSRPTLYLDADCFTRSFGGVAKATWYLYDALGKHFADDLQCIAIRRGGQPYLTPLPTNMIDMPLLNFPVRDIWRAVALPALAYTPSVHALHFPNNGRIPWGTPSSKVITTIHDVLALEVEGYLTDKKRDRYIQKTQRYLDESALIYTVSKYSRDQILRHFKCDKSIHVIPNAATLPERGANQPPLSLNQTKPYFIYTGRYEARKGIDKAIQAMLELHAAGETSSELWVTGKPVYFNDHFKQLVDDAKAKGIVKELGYVSDEALARLMYESRGLMYPSISEGFGLPPLEAMKQACPVITTELTAIPEACGDAVLYSDPNELNTLKQAILSLDRDAHLRDRLIELGTAQANLFSWESSAEQFLNLVTSQFFPYN